MSACLSKLEAALFSVTLGPSALARSWNFNVAFCTKDARAEADPPRTPDASNGQP